MENEHLKRYFPVLRQMDEEILAAQDGIRESAYHLALQINQYMHEGNAKNEMLMRLMHLMRDAELALGIDGVSRTKNMIVMQ